MVRTRVVQAAQQPNAAYNYMDWLPWPVLGFFLCVSICGLIHEKYCAHYSNPVYKTDWVSCNADFIYGSGDHAAKYNQCLAGLDHHKQRHTPPPAWHLHWQWRNLSLAFDEDTDEVVVNADYTKRCLLKGEMNMEPQTFKETHDAYRWVINDVHAQTYPVPSSAQLFVFEESSVRGERDCPLNDPMSYAQHQQCHPWRARYAIEAPSNVDEKQVLTIQAWSDQVVELTVLGEYVTLATVLGEWMGHVSTEKPKHTAAALVHMGDRDELFTIGDRGQREWRFKVPCPTGLKYDVAIPLQARIEGRATPYSERVTNVGLFEVEGVHEAVSMGIVNVGDLLYPVRCSLVNNDLHGPFTMQCNGDRVFYTDSIAFERVCLRSSQIN